VDRFAHRAQGHRVIVEGNDQPELHVLADQDRLSEIVGNLLSNAVKYSPGGGAVRVSIDCRDGYGCVAVHDEGLGIPPEHQERLFTRFHRVDTPDRVAIRGTGLGLYIANQLVALHGGTMSVASEVGRGSTFTFTLPLAPHETAPVAGEA
jgi:signal transduction histidine kinase